MGTNTHMAFSKRQPTRDLVKTQVSMSLSAPNHARRHTMTQPTISSRRNNQINQNLHQTARRNTHVTKADASHGGVSAGKIGFGFIKKQDVIIDLALKTQHQVIDCNGMFSTVADIDKSDDHI